MKLGTSHSLRARLLWSLLLAIVLAAVAQAVIAYRTALEEAGEMFDHHMQQVARSVRAGLPLGASTAPSAAPPDDDYDDLIVQIWSIDGAPVFRSTSAVTLPRQPSTGFSTAESNGVAYRVLTARSDTQIIEVGQNMSARQQTAGSLALRTVAPIAMMMPLLGLVVWWVVGRSLAPLSRVRGQVAARRADDLSPVSESGLPDEIYPLVQELNLLLARVGHAFQAQQSFVGDAAHELRSPLAALKLQAQALQRAIGDEARGVAIARLLSGIDRATRLVEQLLVLARQEASAAGGAVQPVSLAHQAALAVTDAAATARARGVDIGLERADEDRIIGNAEALAILLRNLLDNAIRYAPPSGRVDVEIVAAGGDVVLTVEDSGPGIEPDHRERVLDRFYRVSGADGTGSGLGLAIVKSIAALHAATVTLDDSPRLGGLRVAVRFPAA